MFSYTSQTEMNFFYCTFVRSIHTRCARLMTFSLCLPLFRSSLVQYTCTRVYFLTIADLRAYFIYLLFISYVITISRTHSENTIISNTPVVLLRNLRKEWITICCKLPNRRPKDTNATTKRKPTCRNRHIRYRLQMKKELNYLQKYQEK